MRHLKLTRRRSMSTPLLDKLAILRKLHHASIAAPRSVPIANEYVPIRRDRHRIRLIKRIRTIPRHARLSQRHQNLAIRTELKNLVANSLAALAVRHPNVALA